MSEAMTVYEGGALDRPATAVEIRAQVNLIQEVMRAVMQNGHHYGTIPGAGDKPTLFKPGAEKLFLTFRVAVTQQVEDLSTVDAVRYRVTATGQHMVSGAFLGAASGECSSDEEKYRWRRVVCQEEWDATPEDRRRVKWAKKRDGAAYSVQQIRTQPADVANTVLKMAAKRAEVALALRVTAASDIFTQDIEDLPAELAQEGIGDDRPPLQQPQRKSEAAPAPPPPPAREPEAAGSVLANVTVENISEKSGTSKTGKAWTLFKVRIAGENYSTFDTRVAESARNARDTGEVVSITFTVDDKGYRNLTSLTPGAQGELGF